MDITRQSIFDVLSHGERIIVYSSEDGGFVITWNQSVTFSWFNVNDDGTFNEVDVMSSAKDVPGYNAAKGRAMAWALNQLEGV